MANDPTLLDTAAIASPLALIALTARLARVPHSHALAAITGKLTGHSVSHDVANASKCSSIIGFAQASVGFPIAQQAIRTDSVPS